MKEARLGWSLKRIVYDGIEARGKRWARVKSLIEGLETRLGGQLAYNGSRRERYLYIRPYTSVFRRQTA